MTTPPQDTPDIFRYIDYRVWLAETFEAWQAADASMTHRRFSKLCGYRSSGAIALVTSGRRRLSSTAAKRIAKVLRLDPTERAHLLLMVAFESADEFETRARLLRKMRAAQRFAEVWQGTLRMYDFYSAWYLPVVREVMSLDDFVNDPQWIADRIHAHLSPKQAQEAITKLLSLGFVRREDDGTLAVAAPIISTPSEVRSDTLKQHQRHMMRLASEALDTQAPTVRDMRVISMAVSQSQAARIKAHLVQFHKEVLAIVAEDEPIEVVYQLNTQWFALTNPAPHGDPRPLEEDDA